MLKMFYYGSKPSRLITFINFFAKNESRPINRPYSFKQVHPHLEEDCKACLSDLRVIGFSPNYYSDQASQSMQWLNDTINGKPDVKLPNALYFPGFPEDPQHKCHVKCESKMKNTPYSPLTDHLFTKRPRIDCRVQLVLRLKLRYLALFLKSLDGERILSNHLLLLHLLLVFVEWFTFYFSHKAGL